MKKPQLAKSQAPETLGLSSDNRAKISWAIYICIQLFKIAFKDLRFYIYYSKTTEHYFLGTMNNFLNEETFLLLFYIIIIKILHH